MTTYEPATKEPNGIALEDSLEIVDTGSGLLVYKQLDHGVQALVGFADVEDWGAIEQAARARGHSAGDVLHLPELDLDILEEVHR